MSNGGNSLKTSTWILIIGGILVVVSPLLLTKSAFSHYTDFTNTGQIGDTIGGITAPFVNMLGAILVYYALKAQIEANELVQKQLEEQRESSSLNMLYQNLKTSIDDFSYSTLNRSDYGNATNPTCNGSEAIYKLINDFYCDYHESEEEMECNPKITELKSILEISNYLLDRIIWSGLHDKEVLLTLTVHQVRYRIMPKVNDMDGLKREYCEVCEREHGFPDTIVDLIEQIQKKL